MSLLYTKPSLQTWKVDHSPRVTGLFDFSSPSEEDQNECGIGEGEGNAGGQSPSKGETPIFIHV